MTECIAIDQQYEIETFYKVNPELQDHIKIKRVKFALSEVQRIDLLKQSEKNFKHFAIMKMQLETGQRIGEIANCIIPNLNLIEQYLTVQSYQKDRYTNNSWKPKTLSGNRIVPLTESLVSIFKSIIGNRSEGYVFVSNKHSKYYEESLIRMIDKYAKLAPSIGKNIGSHCLRRTYASFLSHQGVPIAEISKNLGHKSVIVTMRYLFDIYDIDAMQRTRAILEQMNPM